jgi:hypothetical protein
VLNSLYVRMNPCRIPRRSGWSPLRYLRARKKRRKDTEQSVPNLCSCGVHIAHSSISSPSSRGAVPSLLPPLQLPDLPHSPCPPPCLPDVLLALHAAGAAGEEILSKSSVVSCARDSDAGSPLNCERKLVLDMAVPSRPSGSVSASTPSPAPGRI